MVLTFIESPQRILDNFRRDLLPADEKVSRGLFLIAEKVAQQRDALKAVEDMCDGFKLIAENLVFYTDAMSHIARGNDATISMMSDIVNINRLHEWFDALQFRSEKDEELALQHKSSIIIFMKAILWDLSVILGDTDLVPFVLDGEVTYLSANSAEGKAIKRIGDPLSEDDIDWIIVEPDENPIDLNAIRSRLASRGYEVLVEDSSSVC